MDIVVLGGGVNAEIQFGQKIFPRQDQRVKYANIAKGWLRMAEYIERAAVEKMLEDAQLISDGEYCGYCTEDVSLNSIPAADVAEVRHGIWIGIEYDGYADGYPVYDLWECSECGEEVRGDDVPSTHPWCHSCGARMDKEDDHEIAKP